jgi:hypothetical protein
MARFLQRGKGVRRKVVCQENPYTKIRQIPTDFAG